MLIDRSALVVSFFRNNLILFGRTLSLSNQYYINSSRNKSSFYSMSSSVASNSIASNNNSNDTEQMNNSQKFSQNPLVNQPRDITFSTPYGKLAGHEWGNPDASNKFICIHGWLDNCATFELMLPFILNHKDNASKLHLIAYDQSGVGLSCHRPVGTEYTMFSQVIELRRVISELGWKSYNIIGHSMGSHFGFLYSCLYPDEVKSFVSIDLAFPLTRSSKGWSSNIAKAIRDQLLFENHNDSDPLTNLKVAIYSREDAIQRLLEAHGASLQRKSAETLLTRGATKSSWGYVFNRDVRLRNRSIELWPDDKEMLTYLKGCFKPNFLLILGQDSLYAKVIPEEKLANYFELYKSQCKTFKHISMPGTHHLHLNDPDRVANAINEFFDSQEYSTDSKGIIINGSKL